MKISKLAENITSMICLKGSEYILNFILFPYLIRVLGVEKFGAITFMQGIIQYGVILVDYGFYLTAPRDIAQSLEKKSISQIFANVMISKILIFIFISILSFIIIGTLLLLKIEFDILLFLSCYLLIVGNVIFPIWFFQGVQQMRYVTVFNIIARSITVLLVLLFVKNSDDYVLAAFFQSSTLLLAGIFSLIVLRKEFSYIFVAPDLGGIKEIFINGWHVFLSTVAINLYTTNNIVILGAMTNNAVVGYFGAANKLIDCTKGILLTINQAVYPYVSKKMITCKNDALIFLKKYLFAYSGIAFLGGNCLIIFAPIFVDILFGNGYNESAFLLRMMSYLPFIMSISNVFGIQIMMNFGYQKAFSKILISASILDFFMIIPFIYYMESLGVIFTMIAVEMFVTVNTIYYVLVTKKIKLFSE